MKIPVLKKYIGREEVFIERRLPSVGNIYVKIGDEVNSFDTIGEANIVKEAEKISYKGKLIIKRNQRVYPGDVISVNTKFFKKEEIKSTISGRISEIDEKNHVVFLEGLSNIYNLIAGVKGVVVDVSDSKSVLIKTPATIIKAMEGCGEEVAGELKYINEDVLSENEVTDDVRGKILIVNRIESNALSKAKVLGAIGFIIASCEYAAFVKYREEKINLLVLEGFGKMSFVKPLVDYLKKLDSIFCVLRSYENMLVLPRVSVNEILGTDLKYKEHFVTDVKIGDMVQIFIKERYGEFGVVKEIKGDLLAVELSSIQSTIQIPSFSCGLINY